MVSARDAYVFADQGTELRKLKAYLYDYIQTRTVTRPYEGFRHPDWVAPESTVRGRENDSLVRPGYIHPQITSFSGGYGIFRRFTL
jgi:hypothetical protein